MNRRWWILVKVLWLSLLYGGCQSEDSLELTTVSLTLNGVNFHPHEEQLVRLALLDSETHELVATDQTMAQDGKFSVVLPNALTLGRTYYVDYFADHNGNGECDPPMEDHAWRLKIPTVNQAVTINDEHNMHFTNVCESFTKQTSSNSESLGLDDVLTITGQLVFGESAQSPHTIPGEGAKQGVVFLKGLPGVETRSDAQGNFRLTIPIKDLDPNHPELEATMWYTVDEAGKEPTGWTPGALRLGARKAFTKPMGQWIDLGIQPLASTHRVSFHLVQNSDHQVVSNCWITEPNYSFQVQVLESKPGFYMVDYLPPGDYSLSINCPGYKPNSLPFNLPDNSNSLLQDLGEVIMEEASL